MGVWVLLLVSVPALVCAFALRAACGEGLAAPAVPHAGAPASAPPGGLPKTATRGPARESSGGTPVAPAAAPLPSTLHPTAGLALSLQPAAGAAEPDVRASRLLALTVPSGTPYSPCFPPGPFHAEFRGTIHVDVRERYTFAFEGAGTLALEVNGKPALSGEARDGLPVRSEPVRLKKGENEVVARYESPAVGDARVRVTWSSSEFAAEPLNPAVLAHAELPAAIVAARLARGEVLRRQCLSCHGEGGSHRAAPDLAGVGGRLQPAWVWSWLMHPVRSGFAPRQMPHFFAGDEDGRQRAADVAAYLATLLRPDAAPAEDGGAARTAPASGAALFAQLGCLGCHRRPGDEADARTGLDHVGGKWQPGALARFLRAPRAHDEAAAMPDFRLGPDEAAALAAFLSATPVPAATMPAGDRARGRALVEELGCAGCHDGLDAASPRAGSWQAIAPRAGTESGDPCAGPARWTPSEAPIAWASALLGPLPLAEAAEEEVARLRCAGCHVRDGAIDQWTQHAGEADDLLPPRAVDPAHPEVAQTRPSLTWAGEKLMQDAIADVVAGRAPPARPWLHARMPSFARDRAAQVARGLACGHGLDDGRAPETTPAPELAATGAALVSTANFACVTCHGVGDQPPVQVFEVQGVNFALVGTRLREPYFHRWMRDPQRLDPGSKMPTYADARGRTAFTTVLEGDAERQFGAIWAWIRSLPR